jgi:hypothetical protein
VPNESRDAGAADAWKVVPWEMQNYIFFYLRVRQYPITIRNADLLAQVLAHRLARGPIVYRDLDVAIENSDVNYILDEGEGDS